MRILIVDDNQTDLMLLTRLAKQMGGCEVSPFIDADQALASAIGEGCDLILVDYHMHGVGGIAFIQAVRHHPGTWNVPIIMITSESDAAVRQAALEAGATAFLRKPVNLTELRARIVNLLALRKAMVGLRHSKARIPSPGDHRRAVRLASAALLAVLVILSGSALLGALLSYREGAESRKATMISNAFEQARFFVSAEESLERKYRLEPTPEARLHHRQAAEALLASLNEAVALGDVADAPLVAHVTATHKDYVGGVDAMFAAIDAGNPALAAQMDGEKVDPYFDVIEEEVKTAAATHRANAAQHLVRFDRVQATVLVATPVGFVLGMGLAVFFWFLIRRLRQQAEDGLIRETNALRDNEQRFRALVQNTSDVVLICSAEDSITYQSPTSEAAWGYAADALVHRALQDLVHPDDQPALHDLLTQLRTAPGATRNIELRLRTADGRWRDVDLILTNLIQEPSVAGLVATARDITERKAFEEQLTHQAFYDSLTGLPNRSLFRDRLDQALGRAARHQGLVGLLFIDLDNFKLINDSLGHEIGDGLLVQVATRLEACVRGANTIARLGGDEFVILLDHLTSESDAVLVADRIAQQFSLPFKVDRHDFVVTASIGISLGSAGHASVDNMLRDADVAMYRAKSGGKARHVVFDATMQENALLRLELESELRSAIQNGELRVHYQPIVTMDTGHVAEVEALVRWQHPIRGLVPPIDFIPIAEETGLIVSLGQWVLEEASRQVVSWQAEFGMGQPMTVSVNLSPRQFQQPNLVDEIKRALRVTGLPATCLKLEITEGVIMRDLDATIATLGQLKELGIQLAIDDFGTGYSSLAYLKRLPLDVLKIDRSFIAGIGRNQEDTAIVRAIISMAKTLHLSITAEGIETVGQEALLRDWACDRAQGYLFARPLDAEALALFLRPGTATPASLAA